ncbi:MAG: hypothetical protein RTU30_16235, partial [Candidatus Thorarchaeota archaeon]
VRGGFILNQENYALRSFSMKEDGVTSHSIEQKSEARFEFYDCHCGNAIFIDGDRRSSVAVINFYNKVAKQEYKIGFYVDFGNGDGWYCLHCGSRHPKSDEITRIFDNWLERDETRIIPISSIAVE